MFFFPINWNDILILENSAQAVEEVSISDLSSNFQKFGYELDVVGGQEFRSRGKVISVLQSSEETWQHNLHTQDVILNLHVVELVEPEENCTVILLAVKTHLKSVFELENADWKSNVVSCGDKRRIFISKFRVGLITLVK